MATYVFNKERINYSRTCCAIVDLGTEILRNILSIQVIPVHIKNRIRSCAEPDRRSAGLRPDQWTCINNATIVRSYKEFDITLHCKVLRLLSVQDLRNTLGVQIKPNDINKYVQNCPALTTDPVTKLTADDLLTVKHAATFGSYENCKDELLWKLYRHLCSSPYPNIHPTIPWGINTMPDANHITTGDDIERIRVMRNTVYGHISTTEIADQDFNGHWACLEDIMKRLDQHYPGNDYKKKLDDIKFSPMDEAQEQFWCDQMKKLDDRDTLTSKQIAEINTNIDNLSEITTEQFAESDTKIDNLSKTTDEHFKQSNTKIDNLSKTTDEQFAESNTKIDNLSKTTDEHFKQSNTKIDNLSKTTDEQFAESNTKIDNLSKTTDEHFKQSNTKIDNLSKTTDEQFAESNTKVETLYKRTAEQFEESNSKIEKLSKTTKEKFEASNTKIDTLSKTTNEQFQESNIKVQNLTQETTECKRWVEDLSKTTCDSLSEVKSVIHSIRESTATILADETKLPTLVKTCFENTLALINEHRKDKTFYIRNCVKKGVQVLTKEGILILTGKGGEGKTKCSLEIMRHFYEKDQGYVVLDIENIDNWNELVSADRKTLVRLDDPIGKSNTDSALYQKCERFWDKIYACVKSGKTKVILTIREYILNENQLGLQKYELFDECHTVNLSKYKNGFIEKQKIFGLHCKQNNIEICTHIKDENFESKAALSRTVTVKICTDSVLEIAKTDPFIGFPQSCFLFCKNRKYTRLGTLFCQHPNESLIKTLKSMRDSTDHREKMRYCIMSYMILNDGVVDFENLDHDKLNKVKEAMDINRTYKDCQYEDVIEDMIDLYVCKKSTKIPSRSTKVKTYMVYKSNSLLMTLKNVMDEDVGNMVVPYFNVQSWLPWHGVYNEHRFDAAGYWDVLDGIPTPLSDSEEESEFVEFYYNSYCFKHETIVEAVALTFSVCNIELLLELCPWKFIDEFVRPSTYKSKEGEVVIKIKHTDYQYLIKRLSIEIKNDNFRWLLHPIFVKTDDFCEHLVKSNIFMSSMRMNLEYVFLSACNTRFTKFLDWMWRNCKDDLISIDLSSCLARVDRNRQLCSILQYVDVVIWILENVTELNNDIVVNLVNHSICNDKISEQSTATTIISVILQSEKYKSIVSKNCAANHDIFSVALTYGKCHWLDILLKHFKTELQSHDIEEILQKASQIKQSNFPQYPLKHHLLDPDPLMKGILWLLKNMDSTTDETFTEKVLNFLSNKDLKFYDSSLISEFVGIIANKSLNETCVQVLFTYAVRTINCKLIEELWKKFKPILSSLNLSSDLFKMVLTQNYDYGDFFILKLESLVWFLQNVSGISIEDAEQVLILISDYSYVDVNTLDLLDEYKKVASDSCSKYNGMFIRACKRNMTCYMDILWNTFQISILSGDISERIISLCKCQTEKYSGIFKSGPWISIETAVWLLEHIPEYLLTDDAIEKLLLSSISTYENQLRGKDCSSKSGLIRLILESKRFRHVVKCSCENTNGLFFQACRFDVVVLMTKLWENFQPSIIKCNYSEFLIINRTYMKILEEEKRERNGVSLRADVMVWFLERATSFNLSDDAIKSAINRCTETLGVCQKQIQLRRYGTKLTTQFVAAIISTDKMKIIVAQSCREPDGIWKMACELNLEKIQKALIEHFPEFIPVHSSRHSEIAK